MAPYICIKTHEDLFSGGHTKKFEQKSFAPPKVCMLLHLCAKCKGFSNDAVFRASAQFNFWNNFSDRVFSYSFH